MSGSSEPLIAKTGSEGPRRDWVRTPTTLWRVAGARLALLSDGEEASPLVVSGSSVLLWELLETPISLEDLAAELADAYGVDPRVVAADLEPVLERLGAAGAVHMVP